MARFASVRLTLWLLAILTIAMAVATLIPQNAPTEAYLKVFGTLLGPLIAKTNLRNIYGSWWFIGGFVLLALNLLACTLQRAGQLLRQDRELPTQVTRDQVAARPQQARWRAARGVEETAGAVAAALRQAGYAVSEMRGPDSGSRGLLARRGRLTPWTPVIVHVGMLLVLLGAAWGRWPRHAYQATPTLKSGESFAVQVGDEAFGLRLRDAGTERDRKGNATDYWAKLEVLEEGAVARSTMVRMNHPLRYHGVSVVLSSLSSAGYGVEVSQGEARAVMPIVMSPDGSVNVGESYLLHEDPPMLVVAEALRDRDEHGREAPAALVSLGHMGQAGHDFQPIGWVDQAGREQDGLRFRLVRAGSVATLSLDRDLGVPVVFLGFVVMAMGTLLILGGPRRSALALVSAKGKGAQIIAGLSGAGGSQEVDKLSQYLESEVGAERESDAQQ